MLVLLSQTTNNYLDTECYIYLIILLENNTIIPLAKGMDGHTSLPLQLKLLDPLSKCFCNLFLIFPSYFLALPLCSDEFHREFARVWFVTISRGYDVVQREIKITCRAFLYYDKGLALTGMMCLQQWKLKAWNSLASKIFEIVKQ